MDARGRLCEAQVQSHFMSFFHGMRCKEDGNDDGEEDDACDAYNIRVVFGVLSGELFH